MPEHKEDDGDSEEECFDEQGEYCKLLCYGSLFYSN